MKDENEDGVSPGGHVRSPDARGTATASTESMSPLLREHRSVDEAGEGPRPVSADMQQFIGRQLRAVFDDVAKQPVPDRFLELMKQLDSKTSVR